jgi:hypothetical protein
LEQDPVVVRKRVLSKEYPNTLTSMGGLAATF